jgi:hypothetical protein
MPKPLKQTVGQTKWENQYKPEQTGQSRAKPDKSPGIDQNSAPKKAGNRETRRQRE